MDDEDLEPRRTKPAKPPLDDLSIGELEACIGDLEGEILRVRAEIDKKDSHRKSVEGLFKT
jgi:uncharacterized small protein (DUF1192 family)